VKIYGVPDEVLSDNGTVFTGRFIKPRPAEVLFERICRENGITQRLTRPASPTTTGKIERLHLSLQNELLNDPGPFESLAGLQTALDGWRQEYNTDRPHQSLGMAFPVSRFGPAASPLELRVPARLDLAPATAAGTALAGRQATIWADETVLHVLLDGTRLKTLPSRLGVIELARLAADGARQAGPSPLPCGNGSAVEVERIVNGTGLVGLAGTQLSVGYELAGQRVILRMEGTQMAAISHDGELLRTLPCPVPPGDRRRLRGARRAASTPAPLPGPVTVQRRVSQRGSIMVATQRIHVGMTHARKTVDVTAEDSQFLLFIDSEMIGAVPRTTTREIHRYKAYARQVKVSAAASSATEEDLQR
jgi:Integrase core domain